MVWFLIRTQAQQMSEDAQSLADLDLRLKRARLLFWIISFVSRRILINILKWESM